MTEGVLEVLAKMVEIVRVFASLVVFLFLALHQEGVMQADPVQRYISVDMQTDHVPKVGKFAGRRERSRLRKLSKIYQPELRL